MKRLFLKLGAIFVAFIFSAVNFSTVVVKAAPVINLQSEEIIEEAGEYKSVSGLSGITRVSNLQVINLEQPKAGDILDTRATVLADGGYFWEIPVVWVDEEGKISYICLPGKTYRPVLAFFVPKNVEIVGVDGGSGYSLRLPEFLDDIFTPEKTLLIASENYGLTFIMSTDLAYVYSAESQDTLQASASISSNIVSSNEIIGFFNDPSSNNILNFQDYVSNNTVSENTEDESSIASDSGNGESGSSDGKSGSSSGSGGNIIPFVKDLVALHCSSRTIEAYGRDNLNSLLNLIVNVIEPQAVLQLNTGFNAYSTGAKSGAIGKEIGLYVYSSRYKEDSSKDISGAVAYVDARYLDSEYSVYGYYIGINVESLYERDPETNEYVFVEEELVNLNNTVVHELMHAYMDDYTRTGMMGVYSDGAGNNEYPLWFIEGISTTVENAYVYHSDLFNKMMDSNASVDENRYTVESLLSYYNSTSTKASISTVKQYYNGYNNRASAYVSGYLATIYLANLANDKYNDTPAKHETENGYYYDSASIRNGLNIILKALHEGVSLNEVINTISNEKYADTADFQDKFLTDNNGEQDDSVAFCVELLNYLDYVSTTVLSDVEGADRANGSILLPFDTAKTSAIDTTKTNTPKQSAFAISDSKDYVESTVDNDEAIKSAGLRTTGDGSEPRSIIDQNAAKPALDNADVDSDEETDNSDADEEKDNLIADETDTGDEIAENVSEAGVEMAEAANNLDDKTDALTDNDTTDEGLDISENDTEKATDVDSENSSEIVDDTSIDNDRNTTEGEVQIPQPEPTVTLEPAPKPEPESADTSETTAPTEPAAAPEPEPQAVQPEPTRDPDITPLKVETPVAEVQSGD